MYQLSMQQIVSALIFDRESRPLSKRVSAELLWALLPSVVVSVAWVLIGAINIESALSIEYSLGSSSGWHDWFSRGEPGEVIRQWGVPVYDQWSGLGYRLPTLGLLSDTPLSYLAKYVPNNLTMMLGFCAAMCLLFFCVHQWIRQWVSRQRWPFYVFVDSVLVGLMSFYSLWHSWQNTVFQVSGAMICLVILTDRNLLEQRDDVNVSSLSARFCLGLVLMLMPHVGTGVTHAPTVLVLASVVCFLRRRLLFREFRNSRIPLVSLLLAALALLPGILDILRELRLQKSLIDYSPELGVLDYLQIRGLSLESGQPQAWVHGVILLAHTFVFPVLALLDPAAYQATPPSSELSASWNASPWPFDVVQFHGGALTVLLVIWALRTRSTDVTARTIKWVAGLATIAMLVALLNTDTPPLSFLALDWVPFFVLSNGRYMYADLSLLLTLVLVVLMGDRIRSVFFRTARPRATGVWVTRGVLVFGFSVAASLLPYRVAEPVRLSGGQTRFAPLQFDSTVRRDNEEWRERILRLQSDLSDEAAPGPQRVLIEGEGLMGAEGDNEWWGLRTHSQLRDMQLSSLLSWPRTRSGATLVPGEKLQHIVSDSLCHEGLNRTVDFLSVSWSMLATPCVGQRFPSLERIKLEMPPQWSSIKSTRPRQSIMDQMIAHSSAVDYSAFKTAVFHHWWTPTDRSKTEVCGFLVDDCVTRLRLIEGEVLDSPPLEICASRCVATYRLTERSPSGSLLVIPLNYDDVLRAEANGKHLLTHNHAGLLAVDTSGMSQGVLTVTVQPDLIMRLRALSPLACLGLVLLVASRAVRRRRRESVLSV